VTGGFMKILMTGGTGFVGKELTSRFIQEGHEVTLLTRSLKESGQPSRGIAYLPGDPTQRGPWQAAIPGHEVIINLAGASIFSKWSDEYKRLIRDSRIFTTRNIIEGIPSASATRISFLSTSAVGYYGFHGDEELDEVTPPGNDFLAHLAVEWEAEACKAEGKGARVVITRLGIVLGEKGGALGQMIPLFKRFLGGPIGSGQQWFSWVHIKDLVEAFVFLVKHSEVFGPVNVCSPNPVRNKDLAKALGKALHRPSFMTAPGFMVRMILGEFGSVILEGQRVLPLRLLREGFMFQYPHIEDALRSIIQ
jgi:uncharacterized protein